MTPLTADQIYADLNYDWWTDTYPIDKNGPICPATMLYFTDIAGNTDSFESVGVLDPGAYANRQDYIENYLMWEAARQLANGQCTGNISNIKPQNYQVYPIYFK